MWRDDGLLLDMLLAARDVAEFNRGKTWEQFADDKMLQAARERCLMIVGEAASKVSSERRAALPQVAWDKIVGLRHRLVHDYPRIELPKVWTIVEQHIPPLIDVLEKVVPPDEPE